MDIDLIPGWLKIAFQKLIQQMHIATEKRYMHKSPVATLTALKALTVPVIGETREITSYGDQLVRYTFVSGALGIAADDGTSGSWVTRDLDVAGSMSWIAATDYPAKNLFAFEAPIAGLVDVHGTVLEIGDLYLAQYVDAQGDAIAATSGAALDAAEILKMEVVTGGTFEVRADTIPQSYTDGVFLTN